MTAQTETSFVKPPAPPKPVQWLQENLFGTWYNALLTVLAIAVLVYVLRGVVAWALFEANWDPITHSLKLFAVGQYPTDQVWRVGAVILLLAFLSGFSWRVWAVRCVRWLWPWPSPWVWPVCCRSPCRGCCAAGSCSTQY